jgi:hypothetical protein
VLLPPGPALDLFIIVLLLVARTAHGLARRFGADRMGAVWPASPSPDPATSPANSNIFRSSHGRVAAGRTAADRSRARRELRAGGKPPRCHAPCTSRRSAWCSRTGSPASRNRYICALFYGAFALFRAPIAR